MVMKVEIETKGRLHFARTRTAGPCAFTPTPTGYRVLMRWCRELAQGRALAFVVPTDGLGALLGRWLREQGARRLAI